MITLQGKKRCDIEQEEFPRPRLIYKNDGQISEIILLNQHKFERRRRGSELKINCMN